MSIVDVLEAAAWLISAVLVAWMLFDSIKVSREYPEDYLLSRVDIDDVEFDEARS